MEWPSILVSVVLMVGCASSSSTIIGVARSPRGPGCDLMLISASDVYPGARYANDYEFVGTVSVTASKPGAQATDPEVKTEVRTRVCEMGGELIALIKTTELRGLAPATTQGSQASVEMGQELVFAVYAKKLITAPQKY